MFLPKQNVNYKKKRDGLCKMASGFVFVMPGLHSENSTGCSERKILHDSKTCSVVVNPTFNKSPTYMY